MKKKLLSLALAIVMIVSFMVIGVTATKPADATLDGDTTTSDTQNFTAYVSDGDLSKVRSVTIVWCETALGDVAAGNDDVVWNFSTKQWEVNSAAFEPKAKTSDDITVTNNGSASETVKVTVTASDNGYCSAALDDSYTDWASGKSLSAGSSGSGTFKVKFTFTIEQLLALKAANASASTPAAIANVKIELSSGT